MWRKQSMATTHTAKTVRPICQSNNITCVTVAIFEFASRTGSSSSSSLPLLPQLRFPDRLNFLFTSVMIPNSFYTKSIRHFVLLRRCLCYHIYIILPCPGPGLRPVIYYNMYFPWKRMTLGNETSHHPPAPTVPRGFTPNLCIILFQFVLLF